MSHSKKYIAGIGAAFALAMTAVCGNSPALAQGDQTQPPLSLTDASHVIPYVMYRLEGSRLNPHDNGSPSLFGVLGSANGLSPAQVRNLSPSEAFRILKRDAWDSVGADDLPPNMRLAAFNAAMQYPAYARQMVAQAHGSPDVLLEEIWARDVHAAEAHPDRDGRFLSGWKKRQDILRNYVDHGRISLPPSAQDVNAMTALMRLESHDSAPDIDLVSAAHADTIPTPAHRTAKHPHAPQDHRDEPLAGATAAQLQSSDSSAPASQNYKTVHLIPDTLPPHQPFRIPSLWALGVAAALFVPLLWASGNLKGRRRTSYMETPESEGMFGPEKGYDTFSQPEDQVSFSGASFPDTSSHFDFLGLTEAEYAAFDKYFRPHGPVRHEDGQRCKVNYKNDSHVLVGRGYVTMHGDEGIKDSLRYALHAWGDGFVLTGGTAEFRKKVEAAAWDLVQNDASIPSLTIQGLGTFTARTNRTASRPQPKAGFAAAREPAFV